ncbi:uncharacterized protein LOC124156186 [Ischnura elegans]|uniref:uncharacterized protein LOC124156186 n=1 Tax=Ischnura elegans TaxID=197161 RepID=UPI001ED872F8|nr:uncharacterized protein LOC124156186 [Ischnura elegans]
MVAHGVLMCEMAFILRLVTVMLLWSEIGGIKAETPYLPHPCFSSEAVPTNERRFFSFAPANVRSQPPVDCVFVFGGPPGSLLRLGLYDVKTKGPKVFRGQQSAGLCQNDVIRVYDLDRKGLKLRAAYCGVFRRGKMLSMSSNLAVVTYTSDSNDPLNSFNLGVDAVEAIVEATTAASTTRVTTTPTSARPCATAASTPSTTIPIPTDGSEVEVEAGTVASRDDGGYGDWGGGVASGDSDESEEQAGAWYLDSDGSVVPVTSTPTANAPPPPPPAPANGAVAAAVNVDAGTLGVDEAADMGAAPARSWSAPEAVGLEGEDAGKVVAVFSNGTGDEDDDGIAFYYYL